MLLNAIIIKDDVNFIELVLRPNIKPLIDSLQPILTRGNDKLIREIEGLFKSFEKQPHPQLHSKLHPQPVHRGGDRYYKKYLKYKQKYIHLKNQ